MLLSLLKANANKRVADNKSKTPWGKKIETELLEVIVIQKEPSRGVLRKLCSENMLQIHRKTPMPKCELRKVTSQLY